jgi:septal ring factor EnvC (AmiA/AmiB activator)
MLRLAAILFLVAAPAALAASGPVQPEQVPIDLQLREARGEAAAAEAEQRRLEEQAAMARDQGSRLRAEQFAAAQAIAAAEARISASDVHARIVQAHLAEQRRRLAAEQAPISSLLAGLALTSRRPPLLLIADGGSAEELVKLRLLIKATAPAIEAKTAAIARQVERGRRLEHAAANARQAMIRSRGELEQRRRRFAELEARAIRMAETRGSEALGAGDVAIARQEQLSQLERDAGSGRSAAKLARELAEAGPAPLPSAPEPGGVGAPVPYRLPADAPVIDGLGAISSNGVRSRGVTLATRRGAPLIVPADGTVLFAGPFRDYDGVIIIDHGRGWKSVLVNAGSSLTRGAKVRVGDRLGIALGPVEVQLRRGGQSVSPALIAGSSTIVSKQRKIG